MKIKDQPTRRIGLLNMMADGALRATERQFTRLVRAGGIHSQDLAVFSLPELERSDEARRYIAENYLDFAQVRRQGLDALIITGVNLSDPRLEIQPFWKPLQEVMTWSRDQVPSTLCSCLATHAVMQFRYGCRRQPLPGKLWGVFEQEVTAPDHPLCAGLPSLLPVPHSRHNEVTCDHFKSAGLQVLIADEWPATGAGVHLACDPTMQLVVMQGHPEYDAISLLKEYKREVGYYRSGLRGDYPPAPDGYLTAEGLAIAHAFRSEVQAGCDQAGEFPEDAIRDHIIHRWAGWTERFFANWLAAAEDR